MSDQETELYKLHRASQDKYAYFLLAAAGTAIGFALAQTKAALLSWNHVPLAAAAALWACSFYMGCVRLHWVDASLFNNAALLKMERGADPDGADVRLCRRPRPRTRRAGRGE